MPFDRIDILSIDNGRAPGRCSQSSRRGNSILPLPCTQAYAPQSIVVVDEEA